MRAKTKPTPAEKLDEAYADAETYLADMIKETQEIIKNLTRVKQEMRIHRMNLGRIIRRERSD